MTVRALFSLAAVVADRAHFSGAHSGRRGQRHPYRHGGTAPGSVELARFPRRFPSFPGTDRQTSRTPGSIRSAPAAILSTSVTAGEQAAVPTSSRPSAGERRARGQTRAAKVCASTRRPRDVSGRAAYRFRPSTASSIKGAGSTGFSSTASSLSGRHLSFTTSVPTSRVFTHGTATRS